MAAFDNLSTDSSLCGVGLYRVHWSETGGYTHLHRDVPIVIIAHESQLWKRSEGLMS